MYMHARILLVCNLKVCLGCQISKSAKERPREMKSGVKQCVCIKEKCKCEKISEYKCKNYEKGALFMPVRFNYYFFYQSGSNLCLGYEHELPGRKDKLNKGSMLCVTFTL